MWMRSSRTSAHPIPTSTSWPKHATGAGSTSGADPANAGSTANEPSLGGLVVGISNAQGAQSQHGLSPPSSRHDGATSSGEKSTRSAPHSDTGEPTAPAALEPNV